VAHPRLQSLSLAPDPPSARCPLCPNTKFVDGISDPVSSPVLEDGESVRSIDDAIQAPLRDSPSAWDRMLDHVAADHYCLGQTLAGSRPDFELMRYLYGMRVITDAQFKAMQLPPAPSSPAYHRSQDGVRASIGSADEPYCAPYSKRREERMRGQQRGVGVLLDIDASCSLLVRGFGFSFLFFVFWIFPLLLLYSMYFFLGPLESKCIFFPLHMSICASEGRISKNEMYRSTASKQDKLTALDDGLCDLDPPSR
jgi:hypothetical protein